MPSFIVTVNKDTEIRVNLSPSASVGVDLNWVGGGKEDGLICFHVGGVDGEEQVRWDIPELSIGDEVTIKISEHPVVDSTNSRKPFERMDRG